MGPLGWGFTQGYQYKLNIVARELAPAGLRSSPENLRALRTGAPARPSGSKLPRHRSFFTTWLLLPATHPSHPRSSPRPAIYPAPPGWP
ncbi:hypothetical protein ELQ88_02745 [Pseudomonas sp. MPC6]|nr:hypothetical protein ELQ88_02745 [Pseudomonas sp. MPC6]